MSGGDKSDKTEKPTAQRIRKSRSQGQIARSPDLAAWASVGAGCLMLPYVISVMSHKMADVLRAVPDVIASPDPATALRALATTATGAATAVLPLAAVTAVAAIAGTAVQGGIVFAWPLLKPKWDRVNPVSGFKQRYSLITVWEGAKTLIKTLALALVTWLAVEGLLPLVTASGAMPLASAIDAFRGAVVSLMQTSVAVGVILAGADYIVQSRKTMKEMRMSKHEIKQENKSNEGDPQIKQARRSRAMAMSRNRMMADVATADVIVVNPTHVAVALRYDPSRGAPRVVGKGKGHIARRIREIGTANGIPLVADVPLARALHAACKLGDEIPAALYGAVAEILAFLVSLRRSGTGVRAPRPLRVPQSAGRR